MSTFSDARNELVGKLAAAGLDGVTLDPAALPPFVLVDLVSINRTEGVGAWGGTVPIKIVVPPPGDAAAGEALESALQTVLQTLGFAPAFPGTVSSGNRDCPAYTVSYPISIPNPNC